MKELSKILTSLFFLLTLSGQAQDSKQDTLASANVPGMPLPKGIEINYGYLMGGGISAIPEAAGFRSDEATLRGSSFAQYKLKLPLVVKTKTRLLMGFDYNERRYQFENPATLESSVFKEIETATLKSRELTFYYNKSLNKKNFISARLDLALNGELSTRSPSTNFLDYMAYSTGIIYGWQPHKDLSHGVGLYVNYALGRLHALSWFSLEQEDQ